MFAAPLHRRHVQPAGWPMVVVSVFPTGSFCSSVRSKGDSAALATAALHKAHVHPGGCPAAVGLTNGLAKSGWAYVCCSRLGTARSDAVMVRLLWLGDRSAYMTEVASAL